MRTIAVDLDVALIARIDRIAGTSGASRASVIRDAVEITYRAMHQAKHHYDDACDWCGWVRDGKRVDPATGTGATISDGFGSVWAKRCPECGQDTMRVVRPGDARCSECEP